MKRALVAIAILVVLASAAHAATLTITPDKQVYGVGEEIVLAVFGDPEGQEVGYAFGRIHFDAALAEFVSAHQDMLTSLGGLVEWTVGTLDAGAGFADAFNQIISPNPWPWDGPLMASVTLRASAPGTLDYGWVDSGLPYGLSFFDLPTAPGGSVTIVPEPVTAVLLALGLMATALARQRAAHGVR